MPPFSISCPTLVRFGAGSRADLPGVLPQGARAVLVIRGGASETANEVETLLRDAALSVTSLRCAGEPSVAGLNAARDQLRSMSVDAVVACGGGSVIDTGKALAFMLSHDLALPDDLGGVDPALLGQPARVPCIALPTTSGTGAEVTANAVLDLPDRSAKLSLRGRALYPAVAIVDPDLTKACPAHVTLQAGLDALTQVIEAYSSNAATPFSDALTLPAIATGLRALQDVLARNTAQARSDMAWVSLSSGMALANAGLGAAHGIASILGSRFGAPHGALCGRLLIPVLRQNTLCAGKETTAHQRLATCMSLVEEVFPSAPDEPALNGFDAWITSQGLPRLADWHVPEAEFETLAAASAKASSSQKNAVPLAQGDYRAILEAAF